MSATTGNAVDCERTEENKQILKRKSEVQKPSNSERKQIDYQCEASC
jgi:hypothetical protein